MAVGFGFVVGCVRRSRCAGTAGADRPPTGRLRAPRAGAMEAVAVAFAVVFVAELGDKTQLVLAGLAATRRAAPVLAAAAVAYAVTQGLAALAGGALGAALPETPIRIVAGVVFLGFAAWTWAESRAVDAEDDGELGEEVGRGRSLVAAVTAMSVAEVGDKSMLATATLAADQGFLGTWVGATAGMVAAGVLAVVVGRALGSRVSQRTTRRVAAALFAVFGVLLPLDALL